MVRAARWRESVAPLPVGYGRDAGVPDTMPTLPALGAGRGRRPKVGGCRTVRPALSVPAVATARPRGDGLYWFDGTFLPNHEVNSPPTTHPADLQPRSVSTGGRPRPRRRDADRRFVIDLYDDVVAPSSPSRLRSRATWFLSVRRYHPAANVNLAGGPGPRSPRRGVLTDARQAIADRAAEMARTAVLKSTGSYFRRVLLPTPIRRRRARPGRPG